MASSDFARPDDLDPHARVVALQDVLYDLALTSVARRCAEDHVPRLRRDGQHAAALAEQLADAALQPSVTGDLLLEPE